MKKLCVMMLAIALMASSWAASSSAAVLLWGLGADTDWNNLNNWTPDGAILGPVPGPADHAIIFELGFAGPFVTTAVTPVNILTPSWFNGHTTSIDVGPGGSVNTLAFTRLSGGNNTSSTVNFHPGAGVSVWPILQMSFNNANGGQPVPGTEGDSQINLDGGILHLGSLGFSNNGLNTTNIDIGGVAQLLVNGDHRDAGTGNATTWINSGYLSANDGAGNVNVAFDAANGRTVFTAVPEPTSLVLFGFASLGGLMTRKRRES